MDVAAIMKRLTTTPIVEAACSKYYASTGRGTTSDPALDTTSSATSSLFSSPITMGGFPPRPPKNVEWSSTLVNSPDQSYLIARLNHEVLVSTGFIARHGDEVKIAVRMALEISRLICRHKQENHTRKTLYRAMVYPYVPFLDVLHFLTGWTGLPRSIMSRITMGWNAHKRMQRFEVDQVAMRMLWEAGYEPEILIKHLWDMSEDLARQEEVVRQKLERAGLVADRPFSVGDYEMSTPSVSDIICTTFLGG